MPTAATTVLFGVSGPALEVDAIFFVRDAPGLVKVEEGAKVDGRVGLDSVSAKLNSMSSTGDGLRSS